MNDQVIFAIADFRWQRVLGKYIYKMWLKIGQRFDHHLINSVLYFLSILSKIAKC